MKGQTSMVAIVIGIVMVIVILIFLVTSTVPTRNIELRDEYRNLYAANMLLSILNTDTDCGSFSDLLKAEYFAGGTCDDDEFTQRIDGVAEWLLLATGHPEYEWLIEVSPKGFGATRTWGDEKVTEKLGYWSATTLLTWGGNHLEVKLYIRAG
jgi:uncharacterized membrane protein